MKANKMLPFTQVIKFLLAAMDQISFTKDIASAIESSKHPSPKKNSLVYS